MFFEVQLGGFISFNTQNISKNPQPTFRWSAVGAAPWCWDHPGLDFLRPLETEIGKHGKPHGLQLQCFFSIYNRNDEYQYYGNNIMETIHRLQRFFSIIEKMKINTMETIYRLQHFFSIIEKMKINIMETIYT